MRQTGERMSGAWIQYGIQGLEGMDVDVRSLCREVGLSYEDATDPAAWVDQAHVAQLWCKAVQATGDASLGLHAAERFRPAARDLLSHLLISCETLGDGIERATRFSALSDEGVGPRLIHRPTESVFRLPTRHPDHSAWAEFRLAAYWRFAEMAAQRELRPSEVRFRHDDHGASRELYYRVYRCRVRFSAIENCLVLPEEILSLPLPNASSQTASALEKAAVLSVLGGRPLDL